MKLMTLMPAIAWFLLLPTTAVMAEKVDVLFHPYDATLEKIAEKIGHANERIDIAMYNLEDSSKSPIIKKIISDEMQEKIQSDALEVRLIFEGYRGKEAATKTSKQLEDYGIDVRWLKSGRKVHHKFAVIDSQLESGLVISGSANWSLSSRRHYNENIFFVEGQENFNRFFQAEFDLLWSASEEFGKDLSQDFTPLTRPEDDPNDGLEVVFNSDNFKFSGTRVSIDRKKQGYTLTRNLVRAIDSAESKLEIATTRIKLYPIYNALVRAAERGVKIKIVVNMASYSYKRTRNRFRLPNCEQEYDDECSKSVNFAHFLNKADHPNITVRLKYYNLFSSRDLTKQMHSKYLIVDDRFIYSGSFNWSYSAEYSHIENLIIVDGNQHKLALKKFQNDFNTIFKMNRKIYTRVLKNIEKALETDTRTSCKIRPMALTYEEIDYLLGSGTRHGKKLKDACFEDLK